MRPLCLYIMRSAPSSFHLQDMLVCSCAMLTATVINGEAERHTKGQMRCFVLCASVSVHTVLLHSIMLNQRARMYTLFKARESLQVQCLPWQHLANGCIVFVDFYDNALSDWEQVQSCVLSGDDVVTIESGRKWFLYTCSSAVLCFFTVFQKEWYNSWRDQPFLQRLSNILKNGALKTFNSEFSFLKTAIWLWRVL